jgi:ABC-type oligopeptide transport system substrate-binding subunit
MAPTSWIADYPDASDFFEPLFATSAINADDTANVAFYKNPRLDELLTHARRELDPVQRRALYRDANQLVCDEAPWAFTHSYRWYDAWQANLYGFVGMDAPQTLREAWVDRDGNKEPRNVLGRVVLPAKGRR